MGRNAHPVDILAARGTARLTKEETARRKAAEIKLGVKDLKNLSPPPFVENDLVAFGYWKKHVEEYQDAAKNGIEILFSSDVGMLALYCKTYSEYETMLQLKAKEQAKKRYNLQRILQLETAINKKMDMLIKMQDRLFLNPLAKVKNIPKREPKKPQNPMEKAGFNL